MSFIIGLLTFVLLLVCLVLILLVLMQLPKKDAGVGVAFGGGATDALFGAGSGNMLTACTRYAVIAFFVLAIAVGFLQSRFGSDARLTTDLERALQNQTAPALPGQPPASPMTPPAN